MSDWRQVPARKSVTRVTTKPSGTEPVESVPDVSLRSTGLSAQESTSQGRSLSKDTSRLQVLSSRGRSSTTRSRRKSADGAMARNLGHDRTSLPMYSRLRGRTGLRLPSISELLARRSSSDAARAPYGEGARARRRERR